MFERITRLKYVWLLGVSMLSVSGCAVEAAKTTDGEKIAASQNIKSNEAAGASSGAKIKIEANSPADTVRVFYLNLREKKFREAMFLTNLRPAIEGLTDTELKEFQVNFEDLAAQVPAQIEINGEIISGDKATVTAKLPDNETGKIALQQINLRKEGENLWVILTVDDETEKMIKKEGKNYFYALRLETFQAEAQKMLEKISRAEMAYAAQNNGNYGELAALTQSGTVSAEALDPNAGGYIYNLKVSGDKKRYFVTATPAAYGKTGKISYLMELDDKNKLRLDQKDKNGQPLKK